MHIADLVTAPALFLGLVAVLFLAALVMPGPVREGAPLADGTRRRYRLNGLSSLGALAGALVAVGFAWPHALTLPHRHFVGLLVTANVFAVVASVLLYVRGRRRARSRPRILRGLYYGVEPNPELAGVDLKLFSYRPSLMGLLLVNVSFAAVQVERHGELTGRMLLYQLFCAIYVLNYFQFEHGMLYTWDLVAERFGGMLVWGDYVLVPFFYSLPGWFLIDDLSPLPLWLAAVTTLLYAFGFWLFRGANAQKHRVKQSPDARIWGRPPRFVGGLLVSGFWGIGRKLNYTGEILLYLGFTALCGLASPIPYLLPLWLTVLLVHRAWRDDRRCRAKYGDLWTAYCRRARFRMIPFVY